MFLLNFIIGIFYNVANFFLDLLDFSSLNNATRDLQNVVVPEAFKLVGRFIHVADMLILINLELAWVSFKIIWAIILRIKSFIPLSGGN